MDEMGKNAYAQMVCGGWNDFLKAYNTEKGQL